MTSLAKIWFIFKTFIFKIPIMTNITFFWCICFVNINLFRYINPIIFSLHENCPNAEFFHFPVFGLNTEISSVNIQIQFKCKKIRTRRNLYLDTFHAVSNIYNLYKRFIQKNWRVIFSILLKNRSNNYC